jgi:hypothetical protein
MPAKKITFAKTLVTTVTRQLTNDEHWTLYYFEDHASQCPSCFNPAAVQKSGRQLCDEGRQLACDVASLLFRLSEDGHVFAAEDEQLVRVEMPARYEHVAGLFKAVQASRSGILSRPRSIDVYSAAHPRIPFMPGQGPLFRGMLRHERRKGREEHEGREENDGHKEHKEHEGREGREEREAITGEYDMEQKTFSTDSSSGQNDDYDTALDHLLVSIRDTKAISVGEGKKKSNSSHIIPPKDFSDNHSTSSCGLDSIFSNQDSVSSASSFQSSTLHIAGRKLLADILWQDPLLRELRFVAVHDERIGPDRLERNLARVVKQFAIDLGEEAEPNSKPHHDAVTFIRLQRRPVSRDICSRLRTSRSSYKSKTIIEPLPDPIELESESESDEDDSDDEYDLAPARIFCRIKRRVGRSSPELGSFCLSDIFVKADRYYWKSKAKGNSRI